jgi:hypothetical protein
LYDSITVLVVKKYQDTTIENPINVDKPGERVMPYRDVLVTMGIVATISNTQTSFPAEIISQSGELATISLIISLSIVLLISDSRYWNKWASSTLDICSNPLLVTFAAIMVFKIMQLL